MMFIKKIWWFLCLISNFYFGQNIRSIQLFNPNTNDETPIIKFGEQLILRFDDLSSTRKNYRYTIKHYNRDWQEDGLFFTEYAEGVLSDIISQYQYSFNTLQAYVHYELKFPNENIKPKISGNYEIVVYKDSSSKPLFSRRFCVAETSASISIEVERYAEAKRPDLNQRITVRAVGNSGILDYANTLGLSLIQNNNWNIAVHNQKPSAIQGVQLIFQQLNLAFPGNNEFYYFDNKNIDQAFDMVAKTETVDQVNQTYLYPVWAYPNNYQYQPDVNGAYYFRRNNLGIERNAATEADYSWVHFYLDSEPIEEKIYVLGLFNDYTSDEKSLMSYNEKSKQYEAKIYLKQGFYNYILATKKYGQPLDYGKINGNFWQTDNLYQAFLYYTPIGKSYDGLLGYGEYRTSVN